MGDAINVELPVTAEVTQYFADFRLTLCSLLVCLASFSILIFAVFLLIALLIKSV